VLKRKKTAVLAEINVVPYIDVMLVLLVIFMITAPLLSQGINVKLPQASAKALPPDKDLPMVVSIDSAGRYYFSLASQPEKALSQNELLYQVAARLKIASDQQQQKPVYVKGDKDVAYNKVVSLMALLQKAGAQDVGLITDPYVQ
jgi:biopolymer transport protein TolR